MQIWSMNIETQHLENDEIINVYSIIVETESIIYLNDKDRTKIRCTPNHLFLTAQGTWKSIQFQSY